MIDGTADPRRIAIFGATSDIAVAVARRFAGTRDRLLLIGRDASALEATARDLRVRGATEVHLQTADLASISMLPCVARGAWQAFGGLDLALIAYGALPDQAAAQVSAETANAAFILNFTSPSVLIGELAAFFEKQRSGGIATITSVAGDRGRKSNYIYGASKAGLQHFLEGVRHRLHSSSVFVLDIRPGFVATKMTAHLAQSGPLWVTPDQAADDIMKAITAKRAIVYTPWFWRLILAIICALPRPLFHRTKL